MQISTSPSLITVYLRTYSKKALIMSIPNILSYNELKNLILTKVNITEENMILFHQGRQIMKNQQYIQFKNKNIIHLVDYQNVCKNQIGLWIKLLNGNKNHKFRTQTNVTIQEFLQNNFQKQFNLNLNHVSFFYTGKSLNLDQTFFESLIEDQSQIICQENDIVYQNNQHKSQKVQQTNQPQSQWRTQEVQAVHETANETEKTTEQFVRTDEQSQERQTITVQQSEKFTYQTPFQQIQQVEQNQQTQKNQTQQRVQNTVEYRPEEQAECQQKSHEVQVETNKVERSQTVGVLEQRQEQVIQEQEPKQPVQEQFKAEQSLLSLSQPKDQQSKEHQNISDSKQEQPKEEQIIIEDNNINKQNEQNNIIDQKNNENQIIVEDNLLDSLEQGTQSMIKENNFNQKSQIFEQNLQKTENLNGQNVEKTQNIIESEKRNVMSQETIQLRNEEQNDENNDLRENFGEIRSQEQVKVSFTNQKSNPEFDNQALEIKIRDTQTEENNQNNQNEQQSYLLTQRNQSENLINEKE